MADEPEITGGVELGCGRFLTLRRLDWRDSRGVARKWETADRVADKGAVLVVAWLRPSGRLVLIRQYRPPAGRFVYELPAGLIDAGEDAAAAAARELREETGYVASSLAVGPSAYTSPGMTGESVFVVTAEVDEEAEANVSPRTEFDPSEDIETLLIARSDLEEFFRRETRAGHAFDAKLAAYLTALCWGNKGVS